MSSVPHKKKENPFFTILAIIILIYLLKPIFLGLSDYIYYKKELEKNKKRYETLLTEVTELKYIYLNLNDHYIIEKLIREKLFMVKSGEMPIILEKN